MAKFSLKFNGIEAMAARLDKAGRSLKPTAEKALRATHAYITPKVEAAMAPHQRTGGTEKAIRTDASIKWSGLTASVGVGFNIADGGLASVFLMYGTPRMKPDSRLRNAIVGASTLKAVEDIQRGVFEEALKAL